MAVARRSRNRGQIIAATVTRDTVRRAFSRGRNEKGKVSKDQEGFDIFIRVEFLAGAGIMDKLSIVVLSFQVGDSFFLYREGL